MSELMRLFTEISNGEMVGEDGEVTGYVISLAQMDRLEALAQPVAAPVVDDAIILPRKLVQSIHKFTRQYSGGNLDKLNKALEAALNQGKGELWK